MRTCRYDMLVPALACTACMHHEKLASPGYVARMLTGIDKLCWTHVCLPSCLLVESASSIMKVKAESDAATLFKHIRFARGRSF